MKSVAPSTQVSKNYPKAIEAENSSNLDPYTVAHVMNILAHNPVDNKPIKYDSNKTHDIVSTMIKNAAGRNTM